MSVLPSIGKPQARSHGWVLTYICKSEPHIAVVVILTMTSSGCSIFGFGTSLTLSLKGAWYSTAFIDMLDVSGSVGGALPELQSEMRGTEWDRRGRLGCFTGRLPSDCITHHPAGLPGRQRKCRMHSVIWVQLSAEASKRAVQPTW